jgi:hypothetical protein
MTHKVADDYYYYYYYYYKVIPWIASSKSSDQKRFRKSFMNPPLHTALQQSSSFANFD